MSNQIDSDKLFIREVFDWWFRVPDYQRPEASNVSYRRQKNENYEPERPEVPSSSRRGQPPAVQARRDQSRRFGC